jgi:3D (Asp-Asp-Asp) domain-containing protein
MLRVIIALFLLASAIVEAAPRKRPTQYTFLATAHSQEGTAKDGTQSREGTVAADTKVLPLGTRIRISGAGPYSGVYKVIDTGSAVDGKHIDIYLRNDAEAKRFGRKEVKVKVLEWGDKTQPAKK